MKQKIYVALICMLQAVNISAQKNLYIPYEWLHPWPADSLLYKEVDADNLDGKHMKHAPKHSGIYIKAGKKGVTLM